MRVISQRKLGRLNGAIGRGDCESGAERWSWSLRCPKLLAPLQPLKLRRSLTSFHQRPHSSYYTNCSRLALPSRVCFPVRDCRLWQRNGGMELPKLGTIFILTTRRQKKEPKVLICASSQIARRRVRNKL